MTADRDRIAAALAGSPDVADRFEVADALMPVVDAIAAHRAAEALRAAAEDRTTVAKLHPVEALTCFIVKLEDLYRRAEALDPPA